MSLRPVIKKTTDEATSYDFGIKGTFFVAVLMSFDI